MRYAITLSEWTSVESFFWRLNETVSLATPCNQWVVSVVLSNALPCLTVAWLCLLVAARQCPGKVLQRRRLCVQWRAMRVILRSTDRPPRPQRKLCSLHIVDFFLLLPTVGSIRGLSRFHHHLSVADGCRRWSFVLRPLVSVVRSV